MCANVCCSLIRNTVEGGPNAHSIHGKQQNSWKVLLCNFSDLDRVELVQPTLCVWASLAHKMSVAAVLFLAIPKTKKQQGNIM